MRPSVVPPAPLTPPVTTVFVPFEAIEVVIAASELIAVGGPQSQYSPSSERTRPVAPSVPPVTPRYVPELVTTAAVGSPPPALAIDGTPEQVRLAGPALA
ncbi:MAG: hypothetical protein ACHQ01_03450 [Candidatus Limnocylindrales bacterium]